MKKRVVQMIKEVSKVIDTIPKITHIGNPVLRQKCKTVSAKEGFNFAKQLIKILDEYKKMTGVGAGLAAPQIGIAAQVFVTTGKNGYETYINPKIVNYSKKTNFYRESCLSSRMVWGDIERSESIEMKWTNEKGEGKQEKFLGFKARLLQHEYDHLQGICCVDKTIPGTLEYGGDVKLEKIREYSLHTSGV